jgi:hypothetical protein
MPHATLSAVVERLCVLLNAVPAIAKSTTQPAPRAINVRPLTRRLRRTGATYQSFAKPPSSLLGACNMI